MSLARLVVTAVRIEGRTKAEVARDYGVSPRWVYELCRRFDAEGEALLHWAQGRPSGETPAMRSHADPYPHPAPCSAFAGYRFPPEVITLAVRWYLRFGLSYRDVEELLAERGIEVDHVTIYRWVQRFAPEFVEAARARQHLVGASWSRAR